MVWKHVVEDWLLQCVWWIPLTNWIPGFTPWPCHVLCEFSVANILGSLHYGDSPRCKRLGYSPYCLLMYHFLNRFLKIDATDKLLVRHDSEPEPILIHHRHYYTNSVFVIYIFLPFVAMKVQQIRTNDKEAISFSLNETDFRERERETGIARIFIPLAVFEGHEGKYHLT